MLNLKLIAFLTIAVSSLIASLAIAYYYGFALPKKDKEALAFQTAKLSVTPTATFTPSPTASPTATPTVVFHNIPPSTTPTAMPMPTATQQPAQVIIKVVRPTVPINPTI